MIGLQKEPWRGSLTAMRMTIGKKMPGYTDDTITRHGILIQGTAFLQKPFTVDDLTRKVRDLLDT